MSTLIKDKIRINIYFLFVVIIVINLIALLCKQFIPGLFTDSADLYRQAEIVKEVMFNDIPIIKNDYKKDKDLLVVTLDHYSKTKMLVRMKKTDFKEYGIYYYKIKDSNTMLRVKWHIDFSDSIKITEVYLVSLNNKKLQVIYP